MEEFLTFEKPPVSENMCSEMEGILKELAQDNPSSEAQPTIIETPPENRETQQKIPEAPAEIPLPRNARKSMRGKYLL